MKRIILLLLIVSPLVRAQSNEILELKEAVDTLFFSDKEKGLELSNRGLELAYTQNDTFYITYFLDQSGELNRMDGNYDLALTQLHECLNYKVGWEDLKDLSLTYNNLGKTYTQKGNHELALFNFIEALKLMEEDENLIGQAFYLNNIGAVCDLQHDYTKALDYYKQSLKIKTILKDSSGIAASSTNVGITYFNLNEFQKSIVYHKKAFDIYNEQGNPTKIARTLSNLGKAYAELRDYNIAKSYFSQVLLIEESIEDEALKVTFYNSYAELFLKMNELDSANYYNAKGYTLSAEIKSYKGLMNSSHLQSLIYEQMGLFEKALEEQRLYSTYSDTLVNEATIFAIADMESKYNLTRKEKEIQKQKFEIQKQSLEHEKEITQKKYYLAMLVAAIILIGLLYYYYVKKKQINSLLRTQNNIVKNKNGNLEHIKQELLVELNDKKEILEKVFTKNKTNDLPPELLSLSKREMEVLACLALGSTDQEISDKLFISKSTTKTHLRRIYSKLLVNGRAGAVAIAHKYRIIGNQEA